MAYGLNIFGQPNELESIDSIAAAICIHICRWASWVYFIVSHGMTSLRQRKRACGASGEWTKDYKFVADIQFQNLPKEYSWKVLRGYLIFYENRRVRHD